jgi:abscisic acid receptor (PYR/PYL family)
VEANQCSNIHAQVINAPLEIVWSVVRRFERPQMYKKFIQSCSIIQGGGGENQELLEVGSIREVRLVSGIPATSSVERLEILDDDQHIFSFRILGGVHRLQNYRSVTSLHHHQMMNGKAGTLLLESYVVNVPDGNTTEETLLFVDTLVRCNLKSLSQVTERRALQLQQQAHDQLSSSASSLPAAGASGIMPPRLQLGADQIHTQPNLRHCAAVVATAAPTMQGGNRSLNMGQVDLKQQGAGAGNVLAKEAGAGDQRTVEKSAAVSLIS